MVFDSRQIRSLDLTYPSAYHPRAPCVSTCAGNALRAGYAAGRFQAQMCWQFHYASSLTRPDAQRNMGNFDLVAHLNFLTLGAGWHWLPPLTTDLVGYVLFQFSSPTVAEEIRPRLVVTDGTNTDTGPTLDILGNAADPNTGYVTTRGVAITGGNGPFADSYPGNAMARVTVHLANVPTSQMVRSYIEAEGSILNSASGLGAFSTAPIIPHYAVVYWEAIG